MAPAPKHQARARPELDGCTSWAERDATTTSGAGARCTLCGCWRGELGSEPTVEQFVSNLVEVFRQVRRVLHPSGSLWLNLGSSYAGSGKGPSGTNGLSKQCTNVGSLIGPTRVEGWKAKDLIATPFLVAEALRQDGWWWRQTCPWLKFSAMPESVTDRPATSIEWVMLLTPSPTYYYDATAVRIPHTTSGPIGRKLEGQAKRDALGDLARTTPVGRICGYGEGGRNRRNGDWLAESIPATIQSLREQADHLEAVWSGKGLLTDFEGDPLAFLVNPQSYADAHFATYPLRLVEPMIRASTSEHGQCAECGAPWERILERTFVGSYHDHRGDGVEYGLRQGGRGPASTYEIPREKGWQPTCRHADAPSVPQTVLDPFLGSGTTLLAAKRLGRNGIGCELNADYAAQAERRIAGHRPRRAAPQAAPLGPLFGEEN